MLDRNVVVKNVSSLKITLWCYYKLVRCYISIYHVFLYIQMHDYVDRMGYFAYPIAATAPLLYMLPWQCTQGM